MGGERIAWRADRELGPQRGGIAPIAAAQSSCDAPPKWSLHPATVNECDEWLATVRAGRTFATRTEGERRVRWLRWLALLIGFPACLAPIAHLLQLPNKLHLDGSLRLAVQQHLYND
jgi:hypothetical protein